MRNLIKEAGVYPRVVLDKRDNYVIYKNPNAWPTNTLKRPLNYKKLLIEEYPTDDFILRCGLSGVETCLVMDFKETQKIVKISSYYKLAMQGADTAIIAMNLNKLV